MRRSTPYDTNDEMMCAEPGIMPIEKPIRLPRPIGPTDSFISSSDGTS